jgi:hypothetical protein
LTALYLNGYSRGIWFVARALVLTADANESAGSCSVNAILHSGILPVAALSLCCLSEQLDAPHHIDEESRVAEQRVHRTASFDFIVSSYPE